MGRSGKKGKLGKIINNFFVLQIKL